MAVSALGGVAASVAVGHLVASADADAVRGRFADESDDLGAALELAIRREEDLVAQAAGFFSAVPSADEDAFVAWSRSVGALERHPELVAWGEVEVVSHDDVAAFFDRWGRDATTVTPGGERPYYCLLRAAEFRDPAAAVRHGRDFCPATGRTVPRAALDPVASPFQIVPGETESLLVIQAPLYRDGAEPTTFTERRAAFRGWVGIALDPQVLIDAVDAGERIEAVELAFRDQSTSASYHRGSAPDDALADSVDLGNGWSVTMFGAPPRSMLGDRAALATTAAGIVITGLFATVVLLLGTGRARAMRLVRLRTAELAHHALHDSLTGLPNRVLALDRLPQAMRRARRECTTIAVLYLDIDDFKNVNDTFGHQRGDELLIAVAERLRLAAPDADTIARIGGDEFVVVLEGAGLGLAPELVAERILDLLGAPFTFADSTEALFVSCSIGIASGQRDRPADLIRDADIALHHAKADGKHRAVTHDDQMGVAALRRLELEFELRSALARDQLHLVYQPIYRLDDLRLVGVEALLRWTHPTHGPIEPAEFVPILERSEQIVAVGAWVLNEACRQGARWHREGHPVDVSVNLSAAQLDDATIVERVRAALATSGLPPTALIVEITESGLMRRPLAAAERLGALRSVGVRVAVDDFGTGYSSLAYLRQFPLDSLKIDRQFVSAVASSPEARALLSTLARLGHQLGLTVLAEGIETSQQIDELRREHIEHVQGFLFSRPLTAAEVRPLLPSPTTADRFGQRRAG